MTETGEFAFLDATDQAELVRKKEVQAIDLRPHPWEFGLYYDI